MSTSNEHLKWPHGGPEFPAGEQDFDDRLKEASADLSKSLVVTGTITAYFEVSDAEFERIRKLMEGQ